MSGSGFALFLGVFGHRLWLLNSDYIGSDGMVELISLYPEDRVQ